MDLPRLAEEGIRTALAGIDDQHPDMPSLRSMLCAVKAVQSRNGETHHLFEIEALEHGERLYRQQQPV